MRFYWQVPAAMIFTAALTIAGLAVRSQPVAQSSQPVAQNGNMAQTPPDDDADARFKPREADIDLFALISGNCKMLRIAGRDFSCKTVAYAHSVHGRAYFTIAVDDPADQSHIISFSGENGRRPYDSLYELTVDQMQLSSKNGPKADGLPVPFVAASVGTCTQLGNFAVGKVSSIACTATDRKRKKYELQFESDGSPITIRRVKPSAPTIRQNG
jgi:hypothetical protein